MGGAVRFFDPANNIAGEFDVDHLGNFQTEPFADDTYYAVTVFTDVMLDEAWDDIRCTDNCNPLDLGATLIEVPENTTVVRDFILDPEVAFKNSFE